MRFPEFSDNWKQYTIDEIAKIEKGSGISKDQLSEDGEECILYGELYTKYKSEIINDIFSKTSIDSSKLTRSKENDVIIPCSGESAEDIATARCVSKDGILLGGDLNIIRFEGQDGAFMSYQLNGRRKYDIARVAQGVSVVHLYPDHLKSVKINVPQIEEQRKIVRLLSLIDERIATQNKIIDNLQSLIKGLRDKIFTSWHQYIELENFDKKITAGKDMVGSGIFPLYGSTGIIGKTSIPSYREPLVLIARVGSIGNIQYVTSPCGVSDNTIVVRAGNKSKLIYYYLCGYNFKRITSGTTQPLITASDVKKIKIPIFTESEEKEVIKFLDSLYTKIKAEKEFMNLLNRQKNYLLRKMFI